MAGCGEEVIGSAPSAAAPDGFVCADVEVLPISVGVGTGLDDEDGKDGAAWTTASRLNRGPEAPSEVEGTNGSDSDAASAPDGVGVDFEVVLVCVDLGVGHGKEPVGEFHIRALSAAQREGACVAGSGTPGMALSY